MKIQFSVKNLTLDTNSTGQNVVELDENGLITIHVSPWLAPHDDKFSVSFHQFGVTIKGKHGECTEAPWPNSESK